MPLTLFPIRKPRVGLSFTADRLSLAELGARTRLGRRHPSLRRVTEQALPTGLISPSDRNLNVSDVAALADHVRTLVGSTGPLPVALSLPDHTAQVGLFEFESMPRRAAEAEALLRWRFRGDRQSPQGDTCLVYRTFRAPGAFIGSGGRSRPHTFLLAVHMRRDILRQYEEACEQAGLLPVAIGLASLQLFDVCRPVMTPADEVFFAHRSRDSLTFLALKEGCPVYLRMTPPRRTPTNLSDTLTGTLQFYDGQATVADRDPNAPPRRLFLIDDESGDLQPDGRLPDVCLGYPLNEGPLRTEVVQVGWADLARSRRPAQGYPPSGLSAFAGVVAA